MALAIPVVMMVIVFLVIYIPSLNVHPTSDFIYSSYDGRYTYPSTVSYDVQNGKLVKVTLPMPPADPTVPVKPLPANAQLLAPKLYLHTTNTNTNRELSFEEASKLIVDSSNVSTDGFKVVQSSNGGFFPFFYDNGGRDNKYFLQKENGGSVSVTLEDNNSYSFQFLGWVIP